MANFTNWGDIRTEALDEANEDSADTNGSFYTRFFTFANRVFMDLWFLRAWKFTRANPPGSLNSVAPITGITVNVANGATAATLSAAQTPDLDNRKILINGNLYRISAHTGGSAAITLGSAFQEASVTAGTVIIFQDEYDLSGMTRFANAIYMRDMKNGKVIERVSEIDERIQRQAVDPSEGDPEVFTMITDIHAMFDRYPNDARRFEVVYQEYPADASSATAEPDWPRWRRGILVDEIAFRVLREKKDNDMAIYRQAVQEQLEQMEQEEGWFNRPNHIPMRLNPYLTRK